METKQKECEICGVWFTPSRSSQKYCPECGKDSTKAWRDLHKHMQYSVARVGTGRPVSKTEVECKYCHKTFTCYNGVTSAYCSKACEAADRIQGMRELRRPAPRALWHDISGGKLELRRADRTGYIASNARGQALPLSGAENEVQRRL